MRSIGRVLTAAALGPWLAVSSLFAPEHVHEAGSTDHHAPVAHRHFAPHDHERADASHLDHDGAEVEDPDGHVVWVNEIGITEARYSFPVTLFGVSTHITFEPEPLVRAAVAADEATLPHGPPRVSASLRAPPSVTLPI